MINTDRIVEGMAYGLERHLNIDASFLTVDADRPVVGPKAIKVRV